MSDKFRKDYITDSKLMVLYVLLKYSDENHVLEKNKVLELTAAEFGGRGEINTKTLDRSLDAIMSFLDIKSDLFGKYKQGTKNDETRKTNIRIEHIFSDYELRYLIDMVSSCEYIKIGERQKLIEKLLTLASDYILSDFMPHLYKNSIKSKVMRTDFNENLKEIHKAISEKRQIKFFRVKREINGILTYETDENGNEIVYVVNPYRTVFNDGFYYLVCSRVPENNSEPNKISNYRIDRMSEIEIINNSGIFPETSIAGVPKNTDTKKYISTHRMMWGGISEKIRFRCPEWAITEIVDFFGEDYKICSHEKSDINNAAAMIVEVESTWNNMLIWARRFFDFVEIISPLSLRQRLRDDIAEAYEKYSQEV